MSKHEQTFRVAPAQRVRLAKWPTATKPMYKSARDYEQGLRASVEELSELQNTLYASNRYAVLLIFQAMDAAGKDGTIKHVLSGINPQGCQVFSFKRPSATDLQHDFLWRTNQCLPERGRIGVFNRSYYEEVLVVRVHPEIFAAEALPDQPVGNDVWKQRFKSIVHHERHLYRNGTRILKFFLHLSKDEQRKRFLARIDDASKNWKFNAADLQERKFWKNYVHAYEDCISATSTEEAPWYVVPADDKENARLIVADAIVKELRALKLAYPEPDREHLEQLEAFKKQLKDD